MENKEALLVLNAIEGLEPRMLITLLNRLGCACDILSAPRKFLTAMVGPTLAEKIQGWNTIFDLDKEVRECEARRVQWMDWNDARYPDALRQIPQPPPILYYRGAFSARDRFTLGMVGSRAASRYGIDIAKSLAMDLASTGFSVASGLARGIDTAAHEGALAAGGRTLALMGSGFAKPYPKENEALLDRIAENGLVLSEFPLFRAPLGRNFPRRNRLISGLSMGVVVVEAASRSGSLITASHALEQGKSVFAVPGRLDSESSHGANNLIQQGAKLITSVADIVEDLQYLLPASFRKSKGLPSSQSDRPLASCVPAGLSESQEKILRTLEGEPTDIEQVIAVTKLSAPEVAGGLLVLEMQGLVEQLPGKQFARTRSAKVSA